MIRLAAQSTLIAILALGLAYQTVSLWAQWQAPLAELNSAASSRGTQAKEADATALSLTHRPLAAYQQTLTRPLFVDGRRPPPPKAALAPPRVATPPSPPPPKMTLDRYRLLGVHLDGNVRRALIETPSGTRAWVKEGDRLEAWTLVEVAADRARLSVQDQRGELYLYPTRSGG